MMSSCSNSANGSVVGGAGALTTAALLKLARFVGATRNSSKMFKRSEFSDDEFGSESEPHANGRFNLDEEDGAVAVDVEEEDVVEHVNVTTAGVGFVVVADDDDVEDCWVTCELILL
jgi:hypothetical protein